MKKYLQFSKRIIATILRHIPLIRRHYRLRSRIDNITDACSLLYKKRGEIDSKLFNKKIERKLTALVEKIEKGELKLSDLAKADQVAVSSIMKEQRK